MRSQITISGDRRQALLARLKDLNAASYLRKPAITAVETGCLSEMPDGVCSSLLIQPGGNRDEQVFYAVSSKPDDPALPTGWLEAISLYMTGMMWRDRKGMLYIPAAVINKGIAGTVSYEKPYILRGTPDLYRVFRIAQNDQDDNIINALVQALSDVGEDGAVTRGRTLYCTDGSIVTAVNPQGRLTCMAYYNDGHSEPLAHTDPADALGPKIHMTSGLVVNKTIAEAISLAGMAGSIAASVARNPDVPNDNGRDGGRNLLMACAAPWMDPSGEHMWFMCGVSRAGKTTLTELLCGQRPHVGGEIECAITAPEDESVSASGFRISTLTRGSSVSRENWPIRLASLTGFVRDDDDDFTPRVWNSCAALMRAWAAGTLGDGRTLGSNAEQSLLRQATMIFTSNTTLPDTGREEDRRRFIVCPLYGRLWDYGFADLLQDAGGVWPFILAGAFVWANRHEPVAGLTYHDPHRFTDLELDALALLANPEIGAIVFKPTPYGDFTPLRGRVGDWGLRRASLNRKQGVAILGEAPGRYNCIKGYAPDLKTPQAAKAWADTLAAYRRVVEDEEA